MCIPNRSDSNKLNRIIIKKQFKNLKTFESCATENQLQDVLSTSTQYTRIIFNKFNEYLNTFKKSHSYKVLFGTTQPAHLITLLAVSTLALLLYPTKQTKESQESSTLLSFIYLGTFSAYFGAQIWMTFVSGLSLYFSLPRHHFGNVQRVLFPKYFFYNSVLCFVTLCIYIKHHRSEIFVAQVTTQIMALSACFLINLLIRLYLAPPLLRLMLIKNRIESTAGIGLEVGCYDIGPLKNCPHYVNIHKAFRKVHMTIAIGNIVTMGCTILHLHYISSKLCVL